MGYNVFRNRRYILRTLFISSRVAEITSPLTSRNTVASQGRKKAKPASPIYTEPNLSCECSPQIQAGGREGRAGYCAGHASFTLWLRLTRGPPTTPQLPCPVCCCSATAAVICHPATPGKGCSLAWWSEAVPPCEAPRSRWSDKEVLPPLQLHALALPHNVYPYEHPCRVTWCERADLLKHPKYQSLTVTCNSSTWPCSLCLVT